MQLCAGGSVVCDQLASPAAAGLFEQAISQSGLLQLDPRRQHFVPAAGLQGHVADAKPGPTRPGRRSGAATQPIWRTAYAACR